MKQNENIVNNWKKVMLPLSFTFSSLLNFGFYYLGLAFQENLARKYGFIIGGIAFAIIAGLFFLHIIRKERFKWYTWVLWIGAMGFFWVCHASAVLRFGAHFLVVDYLSQFIVFSVPAFMIGICAAKWHTEVTFIQVLEKLSFFAFPAALAYFMQVIFNANPFNWGHDLGIIGYMPFAYTLMPLLMALVIQFADGADLVIPFVKHKVAHPQVVRFCMIIVFWIALYSSGTRGAMICVAGFLVLLLVFRMIHRLKMNKAMLISSVMVVCIAFNLFVYAPAGMKWLGRLDMFLNGLTSGEIVTSNEDKSIASNIDSFIAVDIEGLPNYTEPAGTTPGQQGSSGNVDMNNHGITSRGTLFKIAFKEFLKNPLFGMGPGSYSVKYRMFPHNVILELLAETGIVGTVVLCIFILFALVKLFVAAIKNRSVMYVFLYFLTYAIQANCNGSLWFCSALLCALGYGITINIKDKPVIIEN